MTIMDSMSDSELDARDGHKLFKQNDGKYHSGKWETRDMLRWILYHFFILKEIVWKILVKIQSVVLCMTHIDYHMI